MIEFFRMDDDHVSVYDGDGSIIVAFDAYGLVDPSTLAPLGAFFDRGAPASAVLERHFDELEFARVGGIELGCAVVRVQAGPSLIAALEDENDGWVLLAQVTDYGYPDGHLSVSLFDGDEDLERLYELVRQPGGGYSLEKVG